VEERIAWRVGFILLLIWSSARAYYFAFYVIERYIDPEFRSRERASFCGTCCVVVTNTLERAR
jgi:hypothetical protein